MAYIWNLINTLKYLSGVACLAILLVGVFKILIGDEQDTKKYVTRCKNAIIAVVLIFTVVNLANLVANYFADSEGNVSFSIGSLSNTDISSLDSISDTGLTVTALEAWGNSPSSATTISNSTDGYEVSLASVNGTWYYYSKYKNSKNLGGIINTCNASSVYYLSSVDSGSTDYYLIMGNVEGSSITCSNEQVNGYLIPAQSWFGTKYYSAEEVADAIVYVLENVVLEDDTGIYYFKFIEGTGSVT